MFSFAATILAAQSIQLGINDIVVAGGMESMSNVPKYIAEARSALLVTSVYVICTFYFVLGCLFLFLIKGKS